MGEGQASGKKELARAARLRLLLAFPLISALFFLAAGTWRYWQAWVYLALIFIHASLSVEYLLRYSPNLLERRMRTREKEPRQRAIIAIAWLWFLITFLVPGLDRRFGGPEVPAVVVVVADLVVLLGYALIFRVFRENPHASRIVEVEPGQKVVATGPYAFVRHPMYLGTVLMYLATPLALGSWWALLPAACIVPILVARIRNEESVLTRELGGYSDYCGRTRYRLVPGLW